MLRILLFLCSVTYIQCCMFSQQLTNIFLPDLPEIKQLDNCGKRYIRKNGEKLYGECYWNCEWKPNPLFKPGYNFANYIDIIYPKPEDSLPASYVNYLKDVFLDTDSYYPDNLLVFSAITQPMIPRDTNCLKDCFPRGQSVSVRDSTRFEICRRAMIDKKEDLGCQEDNSSTDDDDDDDTPNPVVGKCAYIKDFYRCLILLNAQETSDKEQRVSVAKDYFQNSAEICYLGLLYHIGYDPDLREILYLDNQFQSTIPKLYEKKDLLGCYETVYCTLHPDSDPWCTEADDTNTRIIDNRSLKIRNTLEKIANKYGDRNQTEIFTEKRKKRNANKDFITSNQILSVLQEAAGVEDQKLGGATVFPTDDDASVNSLHHPWACSLRRRGFRGRHRCGVTLLSGPTEENPEDPFVLVGAAHCNFICKDSDSGHVLETCCCRTENSTATCNSGENKSPFCTGRPVFTLAEPDDVDIICGEFDTGIQLLGASIEPEQVFHVKKILNHPFYQPNREGVGQGGPIEGYDIAVYHVETDYKLGSDVTKREGCNPEENGICDHIWPVCLPKDDDELTSSERGMLAGWLDTPPVSLTRSNTFGSALSGEEVIRLGTYPRVLGLEKDTGCKDPQHQRDRGVNTYYPPGTVCYKEPSQGSCVDFGSSGSGVVREWKKYNEILSVDFGVDYVDGSDTGKKEEHYQYSFVGPLSMSKGCDLSLDIVGKDNKLENVEFIYRGANSLVATDATCFMGWIVAQYGLKLPKHYKMKDRCFKGVGDKTDINKKSCWTARGTKCNFSAKVTENGKERTVEQCETYTREGIALNVNQCIDETGNFSRCDNNCAGVDPNAIIGGGVAAAGIIGISAQAIAGPAAGLGLGGFAAGAGGYAGLAGMMIAEAGRCGELQCRVGGACVNLVRVGRGMFRCPQ